MSVGALRVEAARAIRFAADLLRERGHAHNEACHAFEGARGYCVGMAVILGAQAEGKPHAQALLGRACFDAPIWSHNGVGGYTRGVATWYEARAWVAWSYGLPRDEDPTEWGEDAAVTPNHFMREHGIDPVPYLENAEALCLARPLPHPDLPKLDCWVKCSEGCGRPIRDVVEGPCDRCGATFGQARGVPA